MSFIVDALIQKWAVKRERACPFICITACFVLKVLITSIIKVDTVRSFVPIQASAFHLLAAYFFSLPLFPRGPVDARAPARVPPGPRYLLWQTVGYVRRNVGSDFAPLCRKKEKKWRVTRRRLRLSRLTAATPAFRPGYAALCLASGLYTLLLLAKLLAFSRYDILVCSTFEGYFVYGKWLSRPSCIIGSISVKFYKLMVTSCWQ